MIHYELTFDHFSEDPGCGINYAVCQCANGSYRVVMIWHEGY